MIKDVYVINKDELVKEILEDKNFYAAIYDWKDEFEGKTFADVVKCIIDDYDCDWDGNTIDGSVTIARSSSMDPRFDVVDMLDTTSPYVVICNDNVADATESLRKMVEVFTDKVIVRHVQTTLEDYLDMIGSKWDQHILDSIYEQITPENPKISLSFNHKTECEYYEQLLKNSRGCFGVEMIKTGDFWKLTAIVHDRCLLQISMN